MTHRLEARVHGLVQGVFFRHYTQAKAQELGLSGTVSNQSDGAVFVIAEGEQGNITKFVQWLKQGPELARVDHVDVEWRTPCNETDRFQIIR